MWKVASGRIFGIDSFSTIFVPFFRAVVRARSRVETAAKNCYSRGRLLSQRAFASEEGGGAVLRTRSLARPPGRKNDVCTDTRITSDFPGTSDRLVIGHFGSRPLYFRDTPL